MAIPVTVPRLGWTMDEGVLVEWLKRDGDRIEPGDDLFVLESDKAAENIPALDAGTLRLPPDGPQPGDTVKVGQVVAYLTAGDEAIPIGAGAVAPQLTARTEAKKSEQAKAPSLPRNGKAITPRARRVAGELGIDAASLQGSGRNGRVRERDVRASTSGQPGRVVPHGNVRRVIAARMVAGVTVAAPVTLMTKVDATDLNQFRTERKDSFRFTDLILKLTATALKTHPMLQGQWREDGIFIPEGVHIAFAVDVESGLLAPVIRDADRLTATEIATQSRELIDLARSGKLPSAKTSGATFTVSNLGMFGVDAFTPIIHLPQCAVLGVGRLVREPAVVNEQIVPRTMMTLSLTFDHRVVDGAPAARFLDALRRSIEQPSPSLLT